MADVTSFDDVTGADLTEAQIKGILLRINLNIYNILANKWDALDYAEFGGAGHRSEPTKLLRELREQKAFWEAELTRIPAYAITVWDDPNR